MEVPQIKLLKKETRSFVRFNTREWSKVHPAHFGKKIDWRYWTIQPLYFKSTVGRKIVATLKGNFMAGVLSVDELIVRDGERGKGYGKMIVKEAEKWTKKHGGHLVYLTTGAKWKALKFYKKQGFEEGARLPRHYSKTNFVLLRKYI